MYLREMTSKVLDAHPEIEAMGIESPPFGEQFSEGLYGLFVQVNEVAFRRRLDVVHFDPSTVKALARMDPKIRRGRLTKQDMVDAARGDTGIKRWNHNEADAFIIARSTARFWELVHGRLDVDELTPAEAHSFARIHTFKRGRRAGQTKKAGLVFKENSRYFRFSQLAPEDVEI